jgi:hypothetical protein
MNQPSSHVLTQRARYSAMLRRLAFWLLCLSVLASCGEKPILLNITGFNYTGRYIDSYSVNNAYGGNLFEHSAGGSGACCLSFKPSSKVPFTVKVEWLLADKRDFENKKWIAMPDEKHTTTVTINGPIPKNPSEFEVHFLPDGTVRGFIVDGKTYTEPYFTPQGKALRPLPN